MQFKFESTLKLGNANVILQNLESDAVEVGEFRGNEDSCAHCLRAIKEGDNVIVMQDTKVEGDKIVLDSQLQLVHIGGVYGSACAEDFLYRIMNKHMPPVPDATTPLITEESTKEGNKTE